MLRLQQHELDDIETVIEDWLDEPDSISCYSAIHRRQRLRDAVERIYEVCQTAHARELRKSSSAPQIPLDNDSRRQ